MTAYLLACWDILGQVARQPVCHLLGGRYGDDFGLYRAISQESPDAMARRVAGYRAEGYRRFQLKVGGDPDVDIERILRESAPAIQASQKIEKEFAPRAQELQKMEGQVKALQAQLEKDGLTMSESDRRAKEQELGRQSREFQRLLIIFARRFQVALLPSPSLMAVL